MTPFSLIVITLNAEEHIARCLKSVPFASDVVVVDSGSTDKTVEIATQLGARVFQEEWRGFGPQKRRATELAKHDWVLSLDADEALSPQAQEELQALLSEGDGDGKDQGAAGAGVGAGRLRQHEAFSFPRLSFHMGRWIRHGGWYPDRQVRLYDRRRTGWDEAQLHEKIMAENSFRLTHPLQHWVFKDLQDQVAANNRYSSLGCEQLVAKGRRFTLFHLIVKPKVKFFETYIWKRGFLDGVPGFVIAVGAAYSVFLRWAKLWEYERLKSRR